MRRPFPRSCLGLVGSASFSLALAFTLSLATPSNAQNPSGGSTSLARYVPKDKLVLYLEYEGLDAHAEAWHKTAAYKILNDTSTGAMLEDVFVQLLGKLPIGGKSWGDLLAVVKHVARSGFVFAMGGDVKKDQPDYMVYVFRDAYKNKDVRPLFFRGLGGMIAPGTKLQGAIRAEHKVATGKTAKAQTLTAWVEDSKKEDLVIVMPSPESADIILETLDGKRPNAVDHPARAALAKTESGFEPTGLLYVDGSLLQDPKIPPALGLAEVKKIDYRWGFQDDALMSIARITAPGPRKGVLSLLDGPTFDKENLPPMPESVGEFTVLSVDLKTTLDRIEDLIKANKPGAEEQVKQGMDLVKSKTKLRLKEDILSHLGPKVAWYLLPAKASTTAAPSAASNMLSKLMAGAGMEHVPKAALVFDIDDEKAVGRVIDELMAALNHEFKAQAAKDPGDEPATKKGRNRKEDSPSFAFKVMPGETKMYVMSVPPELADKVPAGLRPAIRLGPKHVVLATGADVARMALEAKGAWKPPSDLEAAFKNLSSNLKMINISDPRDTLPGLLAALPAKLQMGINTVMMIRSQPPGMPPGFGPGGPGRPGGPGGPAPNNPPPYPGAIPGQGGPGRPGAPGAKNSPGGPTPVVIQVDAAKLPSADSIKSLLFPSIFTVEVDDQEIRFVSRMAFPSFGDPTKALGLAGFVPSLMGQFGMAPGGPPPGAGGPPPGAGGPPPGAGPGLNPGPGGPRSGDQPGGTTPGSKGIRPN